MADLSRLTATKPFQAHNFQNGLASSLVRTFKIHLRCRIFVYETPLYSFKKPENLKLADVSKIDFYSKTIKYLGERAKRVSDAFCFTMYFNIL